MASFALGAVGTFFGGPLGGFIGSAIGSLIDNKLFPMKAQGPRLSDLRVTSANYGDTLPVMYGETFRLAGKLIWTTGLIETIRRTKQGGKGGPTVTTTEYSYRASVALALCEGEVSELVKIYCNGKVIYDADAGITSPGIYSAVTFYPGSFSQTPSPVIQAHVGAGLTPAYRGTCYVVIADLQLADFGNRLPNFEFLVRRQGETFLGDIIEDLCRRCRIDPATVSTGSVADINVRGFVIGNQASGVGALRPLALAYNFDIVEDGGTLRFLRRGTAIAGIVPDNLLACHEFGGNRPDPLRWEVAKVTDLPREATVVYSEPGRDYQPGSQRQERQVGTSDNNLKTEIPLVLTPDEGQAVADRLLYEPWMAQQSARGNVDDRAFWIRPGQNYLFSTPAGTESLRVVDYNRGANGLIELFLVRERSSIYVPTSAGAASDVPPNEPSIPGDTVLLAIDAPLLSDITDDTGFYWAFSAIEAGWRGGSLYRSVDGGGSYDPVTTSGGRGVIGEITAPPGPASPATWDYANEIIVELIDPSATLESRPELDVLNGANAAWIGGWAGRDGEIIQFLDAELQSDGTWRLSGLLRGRLGTEHAIGDALPGDAFLLLEAATLNRSDFGASDWNKERLYKPVSLLQDEADAAPQVFENGGESKAPLSPVNGAGDRDGTGDVLIRWTRRSRLQQPGLGNGPVALGEQSEAYEVDILDDAGTAVLRTVAVTDPEYLYTAAQQTADGVTPGSARPVRIFQMSDIRGRGRPGSFTV